MKVLVVGGAGYIGSIMTQHLLEQEDNFEVTVLDNLIDKQWTLAYLCSNKRFNFIRADVRDEKRLVSIVPKFDIIIDLAAYVGEIACRINPWDAMAVNTEAVASLAKIISKNQLFLFPMTNSGYGTTDGTFYCTEETPLNPISTYGQSKVLAEKIVLNEIENSFVFRLATVFGMSPKMRWELLVNFYVYEAMRNRYLIVFEKNYKRNFVHILDVARCFTYCIKNTDKFKDKVYNLGLDDANLSKEELALRVKKYIPDLFIHFDDYAKDPDKRNYIVSNKKILSTGFRTSIDIDTGIKEIIKGFNLLGGDRLLNA